MRVKVPRLVIAGLSGDSGKTLVSLGIARALSDRGVAVRPFKKGPDYRHRVARCCRPLDLPQPRYIPDVGRGNGVGAGEGGG